MNRGNYLDPAAGKVPVSEFAGVWMAGLSHLKESTAERYRGIVRNHVVPKWGSTRLSGVAPSDVAAWIGKLTEGGAVDRAPGAPGVLADHGPGPARRPYRSQPSGRGAPAPSLKGRATVPQSLS